MPPEASTRIGIGRKTKRTAEQIPPWAHRLREAREKAGLTQDQLGELTSISPKSLSNWETGLYQPKLTDFQAVADATGVEAAWIVYGPASREPSGTDSLSGVAPKTEKANRHLIWTVFEVWRFFNEEGLQPNWNEVVSFVHYIVEAAKDSPDDAHAKEAISRKLEAERASLRAGLEEARKKILNRGKPTSDS
jgi:transcriptional regulator with XRE-family HTH domain